MCTIHCTSSNTYVFACVIQVVASGKWPHTGLSAPVRDAFITLRDAVADNTPLRMLNRSLPAHVRADSSVVACGGEIGQFDPWTGVGRYRVLLPHLHGDAEPLPYERARVPRPRAHHAPLLAFPPGL